MEGGKEGETDRRGHSATLNHRRKGQMGRREKKSRIEEEIEEVVRNRKKGIDNRSRETQPT